MTELNRAQLLAWESSLQMASSALAYDGAGPARLRGRLRNTAAALRESVELVRRLVAALAGTRRQLSDEQERLSRIVEHLPIPYLLTTVDGTIVGINAAASAALNVSARALPGRNLLVFLDDRESWLHLLTQVTVSRVAAQRAGKLRPRERLQESVMAYLSATQSAGGPAVQWFVTGGAPEHTVQEVRRSTPTRGSTRPSPPSS